MITPRTTSEDRKWIILFLLASLAARGFYILLFPKCYSYDLYSWHRVSAMLLTGGNPYNETTLLNWPPFWMQITYFLKVFALYTNIPFENVVRIFLIGVETGLEVLLYATVVRFTRFKSPSRLLMWGIALNPISILQVCQHCNFDVLVGFWILLAVYMLMRFQERHEPVLWLFACFAIGMGALAKTVPLVLVPLLLPGIRKLRYLERTLGAILVLMPMILALSIVYVLGPQQIQTNVLGYRSCPETFGFTGLFLCLGLPQFIPAWSWVFMAVYGSAWVGLGLWLLPREAISPWRMVSLATLLLLAIPTLGSGYGPQYIYWFLPLFVLLYGLAGDKTKRFLLVLYAVATVTYLIEYALNFRVVGAFLLEIAPTEDLIKLGAQLVSHTKQALLHTPLWIFYLVAMVWLVVGIRNEREANPKGDSK